MTDKQVANDQGRFDRLDGPNKDCLTAETNQLNCLVIHVDKSARYADVEKAHLGGVDKTNAYGKTLSVALVTGNLATIPLPQVGEYGLTV